MEQKVSEKKDILKNNYSYGERAIQLEKEIQEEKKAEEKRKQSPFKNFIQYNKDYYQAEDWLLKNSSVAYRVFKFLVQNMDKYNAVICSYTVLEESLEISNSTVKRAVKILKENNFIDIYKSGTTNVYCINKNIVWSSWGKNYQYAKFGANIILSKTENKTLKKVKNNTLKSIEIKKD
ncbi:MAG: replication/maintenance protein RepL [Sarcina sp.]